MSASKQRMNSKSNSKSPDTHSIASKSKESASELHNKSQQLKHMFQILLAKLQDKLSTTKYDDTLNEDDQFELEARFGTKGIKHITKIDYDNVIKKLISLNFMQYDTESHLLRVFVEFMDPITGVNKISNVRIEIEGLDSIQSLCKNNSIEQLGDKVKFVQKTLYKESKDSKPLFPVEFGEYNFRVALNEEKRLPLSSPIVRDIKDKWGELKKTFRYINRVKLYDTQQFLPFIVDMSIVKRSHREMIKERFRGIERTREVTIPEYNLIDSKVFEDTPIYEIEIEAQNDIIQYMNIKEVQEKFNKLIKFILSGLQLTNYPISYPEQHGILQKYLKLIKQKDYKPGMRVYNKEFIGYSSYTLQLENIIPYNEDSNIPNIRNNYTVTDKADGDRKLLFIDEKGYIYLIDTNMNVQFTGAITPHEYMGNTLIDGEHILHDKHKKFINLYAAFDIYYLDNRDVRPLAFTPSKSDDLPQNFRLPILTNLIKSLSIQSVVKTDKIPPIKIVCKTFYSSSDRQSIFQGCKTILQKDSDGLFEYNTDGLIFTPMDYGVGSDKSGSLPKNFKSTWDYSFKWKPPQYNTIDFLVSTKKGPNGEDITSSMFQSGMDVTNKDQLLLYKTLILRVGFDSKKHGYMNPCEDIYNDKLPNAENIDDEEPYKPVRFYPTNPYDPDASICNIILKEDSNGNKQMFTSVGELIEDNTIVEFSYNKTNENQWRWEPLRVRYDKTSELRSGQKNFGNAYHVANSNWQSIHKPITNEMISTGLNIPEEFGDDDVYYNKSSIISKTKGLRDFHNLFVKKILITSVSNKGHTLIDYAVGKGGDLPKWIAANLSFVFGIDISRDNIENKLDGVCSRFLNYKKKYKIMPAGLFVNGNSSVNIRNADAMITQKSKQITKAVFGEGTKDEKILGKGVHKQYGKAKEGFDISSMQFALHYMFENTTTFHNFMRNLSECTKLNGYFISTFYDGETIFKSLKDKPKGESISIYENETKIWEIKKMYDNESFNNDDETSLGYGIDVYQETINKVFREYLVNFNYLNRILEHYGFVLLNSEESRQIGLRKSTGMFSELFNALEYEIQRDRRKLNDYGDAPYMTNNEKRISFLNRYIVYKKVRNVNAENVYLNYLKISKGEQAVVEKEVKEVEQIVENIEKKKRVAKKLKNKLKLVMETQPSSNPPGSIQTVDKKEEQVEETKEQLVQEPEIVQEVTQVVVPEEPQEKQQVLPQQPIKKRGRPKKILIIQEEIQQPLQVENIEVPLQLQPEKKERKERKKRETKKKVV